MSGKIELNRSFTDFLKLLAALLVASGHYSGYAVSHGHGNVVYNVFVATGGYIGVAIFFFLSGYGLMMSEIKRHAHFLSFIKRRLVKLYLPVVLVSAIWGIVRWPDGMGIEWIGQYLYLALWDFGDGILWFVRVIIVEYLLFAAYIHLNVKSWMRESLLCLGTALVYVFVYFYVGAWAAISIPMFTLGILLAKYESWFYSVAHGKGVILWIIAITGIMGLAYYLWGNVYAHTLLNYYVITGIIAAGAYSITTKITPPHLPDWAGSVSYDIYLTHYKVLYYCTAVYGFIGLHHFIVGLIILSSASCALRKILNI